MRANGATAKSAAAETESVGPAAVGKVVAPDEAVAASSRYRAEGTMAAVCPSARVVVAAFGADWTRSTRLWLGWAQSLHVRDTEAGRSQFQGSGCKCCERAAAPLARIPTDGASWISGETALEICFLDAEGGQGTEYLGFEGVLTPVDIQFPLLYEFTKFNGLSCVCVAAYYVCTCDPQDS